MVRIQKASTTDIIAVMLLAGTLGYCYLAHLVPSKAKDTTDTQITQGLFGALMLMLGFFFGAMKRNMQDNANTAVENANNVTVNPPSPQQTTNTDAGPGDTTTVTTTNTQTSG